MEVKKLIAFNTVIIFSLTLAACAGGQVELIHELPEAPKEISEDIPEPLPSKVWETDETPPFIQYTERRRYEFANGFISEEIKYYALAEYGEYYFSPSDDLTEEFMREIIAVSEEGIKFAKDWVGCNDNEPIRLVLGITQYEEPTNPDSFVQKLWGGGGFISGGEAFINMDKSHMPSVIVHETVHSILRKQGRFPSFYNMTPEPIYPMYLEEGICNVIDYLFYLETEHYYIDQYSNPMLIEDYGYRETTISPPFHFHALNLLEYENYFADEDKYGTVYPELMSYDTAASFIWYLLDSMGGTNEDIMRIYDDISLMEEVFGANTEDMVEQWLRFLS